MHGPKPGNPDVSPEARSLAMQILPGRKDATIYVIAHAHWEPNAFELPRAARRENPGAVFLDMEPATG